MCILKLITATIHLSAQIDLLSLVREYLTCELNLHLLVKVTLVVAKVAKSA